MFPHAPSHTDNPTRPAQTNFIYIRHGSIYDQKYEHENKKLCNVHKHVPHMLCAWVCVTATYAHTANTGGVCHIPGSTSTHTSHKPKPENIKIFARRTHGRLMRAEKCVFSVLYQCVYDWMRESVCVCARSTSSRPNGHNKRNNANETIMTTANRKQKKNLFIFRFLVCCSLHSSVIRRMGITHRKLQSECKHLERT